MTVHALYYCQDDVGATSIMVCISRLRELRGCFMFSSCVRTVGRLGLALSSWLVLVALLFQPCIATASPAGTSSDDAKTPLIVVSEVKGWLVGWSPIRTVSVATTPSSIRTGINCGMGDMCGLDPCLCGSAVDDWGVCACNGLKTTRPSVSVESKTPSVARAVNLRGHFILWPLRTGEAKLVVHGSLVHYQSADSVISIKMTVGTLVGFYALVVLAFVLAAGFVLLVVRLFRCIKNRRRLSAPTARRRLS